MHKMETLEGSDLEEFQAEEDERKLKEYRHKIAEEAREATGVTLNMQYWHASRDALRSAQGAEREVLKVQEEERKSGLRSTRNGWREEQRQLIQAGDPVATEKRRNLD